MIPALVLASLIQTADLPETEGGFGPPETVWTLIQVDGEAVAGGAFVQFGDAGQVTGRASCNRFFGSVTADYPDLSFGPMGATKMACPDAAWDEARFFRMLDRVSKARRSGDYLILTTVDDETMLFTSAE